MFYGFSGKFTSAGSYSTIIFRGTESAEHCFDIPDVDPNDADYRVIYASVTSSAPSFTVTDFSEDGDYPTGN